MDRPRPLPAIFRSATIRRFVVTMWLSAILVLASTTNIAVEPSRHVHVRSYTARVTPNLSERSITGWVDIAAIVSGDPLRTIDFDSGDLQVDAALVDGVTVRYVQSQHRVTLTLPAPRKTGTALSVQLRYHGFPTRGVTFLENPSLPRT